MSSTSGRRDPERPATRDLHPHVNTPLSDFSVRKKTKVSRFGLVRGANVCSAIGIMPKDILTMTRVAGVVRLVSE